MVELPTAIHIIAKLELGGAQRIVIETARRLEGYRNVLVSGVEGPLVAEALNLEDVRAYLLPCLKREIHPLCDFLSFLQIARIVSREAAGGRKVIVHSHGSKAGVLARIAGRAAGASGVIHTIHGFAFHQFQPKAVKLACVLIERLCARFCDRLVAVSRATMRKGLRERIGTPDKYRVVNPAILEEHYQNPPVDVSEKKRELGIALSSPVVGTVCCFKPQKAPLDFVEMARRVKKEVPQSEFVMVGDGVLMAEVERSIEDKDLSSTFHLLGWREDVAEIMETFDVFALTSLWEGLPMVHAEAMSKGKPVVATSVDGTPEVVLDGVNGFLTSPGDVNKLADRVIQLLQNDELREKMGKTGRQMVSPRFTMDRLVRDVASLYGEVLCIRP